MDISIVQSLVSTIVTRYGANAGTVAAHAARQAHQSGDLDGAKQWDRVHQSIEKLTTSNSPVRALDLVV